MDHQLRKAEIRATKLSRDDFKDARRLPIRLILDSLKVAANVGSILRIADAVTAEHVYICGNTIFPPNYKLKQASIGAERWVSWNYQESILDAISDAKSKGFLIYSVEFTRNSAPYSTFDFSDKKCAFVFGREFDGVDEEILSLSDACIHLPMLGMCNSINVASAASIICYEFLRQNASKEIL